MAAATALSSHSGGAAPAVAATAVYVMCGVPAAVAVAASLLLETVQAHVDVVAASLMPLAAVACVGFAAAVALTQRASGRRVLGGEDDGWVVAVLRTLSWLSLATVLAVAAAWLYVVVPNGTDKSNGGGLWALVAVVGTVAEALMAVAAAKTHNPPVAVLPAAAPADTSVPVVSTARTARPTGPGAPWHRRRLSSSSSDAVRARQPLLQQLVRHDLPLLVDAVRSSPVGRALHTARALVVVAVLTNTQAVLATLLVAPFVLWSWRTALAVGAVWWSFYALTYRGRPEKTGWRRWPAFQRSFVLRDVVHWFDGQVLVDRPLDPRQQYIFGFAPHGIVPLTASWVTHHPAWRALVTQVETVILGATVFQMVPIVRDLALWAGTRAVSRDSFAATLAEGKSVLLIPGGMAEMRLSRSRDRNIRLVTHHKGFVAMALRTGTPLVPVYSFGETRFLDQAELLGLSRWLHRTLGIPLPYFCGIGGWIPLPRRERVRVVVGPPLHVPKVTDPSPALVDQYTALFYASVHDIFERYKHQCGHGDSTLDLNFRLHGGVPFAPGSASLRPGGSHQSENSSPSDSPTEPSNSDEVA
jgi:1-acyl-sn-glycerol-3-phosphate acyltransferase